MISSKERRSFYIRNKCLFENIKITALFIIISSSCSQYDATKPYISEEESTNKIDSTAVTLGQDSVIEISKDEASTFVMLGHHYKNKELSDSAIYYFRRYFHYIHFSDLKIDKKILNQAYQALGEIYLDNKMYEDAYHLNNQYITYKERFYEEDLKRSIVEMNKIYDLTVKEQEVEDLNLEIQHAKRQLWGSILVFTLCVLVASLLIVSYLNRRKYKQLLEQAQYKQRLLRSQMPPHLILNTIDSIQHYLELDQNKLANKYLIKFSRLMQATLENSAKSFVSINREMEALYDYLDLQKMRFEDLFIYDIDSDFDLEDEFIFIPPMIIQPFVENSILHGFKDMKKGGVIKIFLMKRDGYLHCIINDNGVGLVDRNHISSGRDRESISSEITSSRLALFGKQLKAPSGIEVFDKLAKFNEIGVQVVIDIPYKE